VFPVRYGLDSYIIFRGNSVVKVLNHVIPEELRPIYIKYNRVHLLCITSDYGIIFRIILHQIITLVFHLHACAV
jgi:hypothetical protein